MTIMHANLTLVTKTIKAKCSREPDEVNLYRKTFLTMESNIKILLVDDEPLSNFVAGKFLEKHYEVKSVTNGYDALETLKNEHFDIVLLDINLGDEAMDGIKVMRLIRSCAHYKRVKIIAVTAHSSARDWYIAEGFNEFFMKPLVREGILPLLKDISEEIINQRPVRKQLAAA
jgi:CheY-like chemotaxis protein